jgi:hypothetical protein
LCSVYQLFYFTIVKYGLFLIRVAPVYTQPSLFAAPNFVSSMTQGDFVYFFFRETAVEYINCGKVGDMHPRPSVPAPQTAKPRLILPGCIVFPCPSSVCMTPDEHDESVFHCAPPGCSIAVELPYLSASASYQYIISE